LGGARLVITILLSTPRASAPGIAKPAVDGFKTPRTLPGGSELTFVWPPGIANLVPFRPDSIRRKNLLEKPHVERFPSAVRESGRTGLGQLATVARKERGGRIPARVVPA